MTDREIIYDGKSGSGNREKVYPYYGSQFNDIVDLPNNSSTVSTSVTDTWYFQLWDSVNSLWKKVTGTNVKAWLKLYFDTIYATIVSLSNYLKLTAISSTKHYTGFPNRTDTSISWNDGSTTLTLTATSDIIWIDGVEYTINTLTKSLSVAQEAVSGLYWFWITAPGGVPQINCDLTIADHFGQCLVATVYWNTTINKGLLSDERHWMGRDKFTHEYLHETVGARYANGMGGTFTDTTISIDTGEFYDEDIEHKWIAPITTVKVLYHNGSNEWQWDILTTPYKVVNPGVDDNLQYNTGTTLSTSTANKYVNYFVFTTADDTHKIHIIIGTAQYNNIADARAAAVPSLGSLGSAEVKLIYKVTYKNNSGSPQYIETTDYRQSSTLPSGGYVATDHGSLTGLADDDHPQYTQVGDGLTITGSGTVGDPFVAVMGAAEIWTDITATYASASTFTFAGTDKDVSSIELSLFTCTNAAGTKRRVGYILSSVNAAGTITATVVTDTDLLATDIDFKIAYSLKITNYILRITIPGEVIEDVSYAQGMFIGDLKVASYLLPPDYSVLTAAAGAGAACVANIYKGTSAMHASAPDLTTNTYLRQQRLSKDGTSSTTQFDITNPSGTTFRYTYDGTGTDPGYTATNPAVGDTVIINGQNFNAGNNGTFVVTASGANYFEITNASGVAENNKTIGTGYLRIYGLTACSLALGDNLSLRITSSAGATNKASNFQAKLYIVPQLLYTAF